MSRLVIPHKNGGTPSSARYLEDSIAVEHAHNATTYQFAPNFTSGTSAVNVGATGFSEGWFDRTGDRVFFDIMVEFQTGFSFGAGGSLIFSLPIPHQGRLPQAGAVGYATGNPASGNRAGIVRMNTSDLTGFTVVVLDCATNAFWSNTVPAAWAAGNYLSVSGVYRGVATP